MIFKSFEEEQNEMNLNMYKYILEGKQKSFPMGFWSGEGDAKLFKKYLLYYIHEVLRYPKDEIPYKKISKQMLLDSKLSGAYRLLFKNRIEVMFQEIFPEAYPYKMPLIHDELWHGTGMWEGYTPLKEIFPKWYFTEHLGLTEDNVVGLIDIANDDEDHLRRITRTKYRSLAQCISYAFPNKSVTEIKKGLKARTTSRVNLRKQSELDPMFEFTVKMAIYQSDRNCYFTNTGCNIHVYEQDNVKKIRIINPDRQPIDREIKFIKKSLFDETVKFSIFKHDVTENEITLTELKELDKLQIDDCNLL